MTFRSISTLLLAGAFVYGGGAVHATAAPAPLPITEARNAAAGYAISHHRFIEKLAAACRALPAPVPALADSALAGWRERNGETVRAAEAWALYTMAMIGNQEGDEAARAFHADTSRTLEAGAESKLRMVLGNRDADAAACGRWLGLVDERELEMSLEAEFQRELAEIVTFYRDVLAPMLR